MRDFSLLRRRSAPRFRSALTLSVLLSGLAAFTTARAGEISPKARAAVSAALQSVGEARLIILLDGPSPRGDQKLSERDAAAFWARHEATRDQLREGLSDEGLKYEETLATALFPFWGVSIDEPEALERLLADPLVRRVYHDALSAPSLSASRGVINVTGAGGVHSSGFTGNGQVVAVLDTGVDNDHPMLDGGKVVAESCHSSTAAVVSATSVCPGGAQTAFGPDSADDPPSNLFAYDHGTHVAAIVAGDAFNDGGTTIAGVAPDASIFAVQVFSQVTGAACAGNSPCLLTFGSDQVEALEHIFAERDNHNIVAVNMSLGGAPSATACDDQPQQLIISTLRAAGIAVIAASGNESSNTEISSPACISDAIAVGSTRVDNDEVSNFSNHNALIDLLAPGQVIRAAVPGGGAGFKQGTSMATPHVAGVWALLKEAVPAATVDEVLTALASSPVRVSDPANGIEKPRIDAADALALLDDGADDNGGDNGGGGGDNGGNNGGGDGGGDLFGEDDADGDELNDAEEQAAGTSPDTADSDGDGLTDGEEVAFGLNPLNADSDGDGTGDLDEILATPPCGADCPPIVWQPLPAGSFNRGDFRGAPDANALPIVAVNLGAFSLSQSEVTVAQYATCVNAGVCSTPAMGAGFNWGQLGREAHPVNGVTWAQALRFAHWVGARLPSESEWEYAARSGGNMQLYPWGDAPPTCDRADFGGPNCGAGTSEVCTHPNGDSAQGICDLAGNVFEWVADERAADYLGAPDNGAPYQAGGVAIQIVKGRGYRGGAHSYSAEFLRSTRRDGFQPRNRYHGTGIRLAR